MSTLTISIDRSLMDPPQAALVLSGADDGSELGIESYVEPDITYQVDYAPDSRYVHGSVALSARIRQTVLNFDVSADAATEAEARALIAELRVAVSQFAFEVTVTVDDADPEVWSCVPGSVGGAARTYENLKTHKTVYPVSIPCHPIPGA